MSDQRRRHDPIGRREFLTLAGGVLVLAACGGGDNKAEPRSAADKNFTDVTPGIVSADLYASSTPQRLAFVLLAKEGYASGKPASIAFAPRGQRRAHFIDATPRSQGLPEFRGVYSVQATLPVPGIYNAGLRYDGKVRTFYFEVKAKPETVVVGKPAIKVASPTISNPRGVDPICTRTPRCPLHERSLDAVLGRGKPVALMFATPARCQTQYCGPVLDVLLPLQKQYGDKIEFLHIDIYKNRSGDQVSPAVAAWKLPSEPWLFGIDGQGIVRARLDAAFDRTEIKQVLDGLA